MNIVPLRSPRLSCRLFWAVAASAVAGLFACIAARGTETTIRSFNLPADRLENSVKRFAAQSGWEVLIASDTLEDVQTHSVVGKMTSSEALDAMLAGTGLTVFQDARTSAFAIQRETSERKGEKEARERERSRTIKKNFRHLLPPKKT